MTDTVVDNQSMTTVIGENIELPEAVKIDLELLANKVSHVFVTGAGGFLGKAICKFLRCADIKVTGFARGHYPELEGMGVDMVQGDICDAKALTNAMQGCDLVFHVASKAGVWGSKTDYFKPNVQGANHVIQACQALNVNKLVYTSTPSVTFDGVDEAGIDESQPYAKNFLNYYGESKAQAEQLVLKANSITLKTVALRPHLIWGPEDPHLVPRVIERAKAGRLKLLGSTDKLVDTIYVDNAAYGHILAALKLTEDTPACAGKSYFISNEQPITMADMLNKILACVELAPISKRVPTVVAYTLGCILEGLYRMLGKKEEPMMTRFVARQLSTCHYFDISAAKRDLGYQAIISIDEGMNRLKKSLCHSN